ncbi:MAG: deoxyribodipyrimidine photo-lyase [Rhodospirillales bacterium]|nr:deoxyribodipyrimidine photo-lyase [Rhodospirillales bacterium]
MTAPVLIWLHRELRIADNPLFTRNADRPLVVAYILDDETPGPWKLGGAARWWLHHSLASLLPALAEIGGRLVLRRGPVAKVIAQLADETGARDVHAGETAEPWLRRAQSVVAATPGLTLTLHRTRLLFHPDEIRTGSGTPYGVFTPFSRACLARGLPPAAEPAPPRLIAGPDVASDRLEAWELLPTRPDWAGGLRAAWQPGATGAEERLAAFLRDALDGYAERRNLPGVSATSRLSPHLAWGEISPARIWRAAEAHGGNGLRAWVNELLWREFAAHLLWHHPHMAEQPLRPAFARMPWRHDPAARAAWQRGETGIGLVDGGMRELWTTGWMHNRVRMIAASFLVKHLLIPWQEGEAWFWDTLVDADLATNAASWQWVAGSGADAAPYFRIFNPDLQAAKFDPDGSYVRRWAGKPRRPIVDLAAGRARALAAFQALATPAGRMPDEAP